MVKWDNRQKLYISATEKFVELELDDELQLRYAISNFGRLVSFTKSIEYGRILNGSITEGYRIFRYRIRLGKKTLYKHRFFHRLVAENFLEKTSAEQTYVLHLDHNLANDVVDNLKWVTKQEMLDHQHKNPKVLKGRKVSIKRLRAYHKKKGVVGNKLTEIQVMHIKKILSYPKRKTRLKIIARRFGISEMQVYRIKSGENWGHVKIDGLTTLPKLPQKPKKEPTKQNRGKTWDEKLEAYRNGEKSNLITRWITYNRRQHQECNLSEEQFEKLIEINFPFEAAPKIGKANNSWNRQFEEWKKGDRKSVKLRQWKQRSIRRFVEGKLAGDRIEKLKEVGILK
jgi:hypothetical protein